MYKIKFSPEVHIILYSQPPPPPLMRGSFVRFQAREGIQGEKEEKGEKGWEKGGREGKRKRKDGKRK